MENEACWICFNNTEKNILLSNVEAEKLLNKCVSHLDTSILVKSLGSKMLLTICNCCFNSALQLVQLDEQLEKLRQEIKLTGSLFSRSVIQRRNQFTKRVNVNSSPPVVNNILLSADRAGTLNLFTPVVTYALNDPNNIHGINMHQPNLFPQNCFVSANYQHTNEEQNQNHNFDGRQSNFTPLPINSSFVPTVPIATPILQSYLLNSSPIPPGSHSTEQSNEFTNNYSDKYNQNIGNELFEDSPGSCFQRSSDESVARAGNEVCFTNENCSGNSNSQNSQEDYAMQYVDVKREEEFPTEHLLDHQMEKECPFDELYSGEDKCVNIPLDDECIFEPESDPLEGVGESAHLKTRTDPESKNILTMPTIKVSNAQQTETLKDSLKSVKMPFVRLERMLVSPSQQKDYYNYKQQARRHRDS